MAAKFEIRNSHGGFLGETRVNAEFRREYYRSFTLHGPAEISTTDAYVRAVQHWASLAIVTYFFSEWPAPFVALRHEGHILGALIQMRKDERILTFRTTLDEALTVTIDAKHLVIDIVDAGATRQVLSEEWTAVAVLHLELAHPTSQLIAIEQTLPATLASPAPVPLIAK